MFQYSVIFKTVKACQIISDLLAVRLNELGTSLLQQLNITQSNWLSFWVFIMFGSWQVTRNATKSESVALKRSDL